MVNSVLHRGYNRSGRHGMDPAGVVREDFYLNLAIVMTLLIGASGMMAVTFPIRAADHTVSSASDCRILLFITQDGMVHLDSPGSPAVEPEDLEGKVRAAMQPFNPPVSLAVLRPPHLQVEIEDDVLQRISRIAGVVTFVSQVEFKSQ